MAVDTRSYALSEYHALIDMPENRERILELIDGEIVEKMPSFTPSLIAAEIIFNFKLYLREHDLGFVTGADGGYVMSDGNVFIPDVGYISKARLPEVPAREVPVPPDLAVEVKSPTDTVRALRRKAERYLELGTQMVWLVFPDEQVIEVYMHDEDVKTVGVDSALDGAVVLPGFSLAVSQIFPSSD